MKRFQQARQEILRSDSAAGVALALQHLLDQILPSEMMMLPEGVARILSTHPQTVPEVALELTRAELRYSGDPEVATLLREVAQVFVAASGRLGALEAKARLLGL